LLYRRLQKGVIGQHIPVERLVENGREQSGNTLTWGPFHLPGWFGILNNIFACGYILMVVFFSFWPAETPTTPAAMNWSVVITSFVVVWSVGYYYIWGKFHYTGPVVEIESLSD